MQKRLAVLLLQLLFAEILDIRSDEMEFQQREGYLQGSYTRREGTKVVKVRNLGENYLECKETGKSII